MTTQKKKTRKRNIGVGISLALLIAVLAASSAFRALPPEEYSAMDEIDQEMFNQLSRQHAAFREKATDIWGEDYRYDLEPKVLLRSPGNSSPLWSYAYLINMSDIADTSQMRKVDLPQSLGLFDVYVSNTYAWNEPLLWLPNNFTTLSVSDREVLAFKYSKDRFAEPPVDGLDFEHFSLHEAFHVDMQKNWLQDRLPGSAVIIDYPYTGEHYQLLSTEFSIYDRITAELRGQADINALRTLAMDLTQIRLSRYAKWPQLVKGDNIEAIEGTSRYVEGKYDNVVGAAGEGGSTFSDVISGIREGEFPPEFLERDVFYSSGAMLGLLLDRLEPDWKTCMKRSSPEVLCTQFGILQESLGAGASPSQSTVEEIINRYS